MQKILLIIITIVLLSVSKNVNAQSVFTDISQVETYQSCFANERKSYDGFIAFNLKQLKTSLGKKAVKLTDKALKKRLPISRYDFFKENFNCQLITYRVNDTLVEGYYLAKKNLSTPRPLVVFNRGGNGNFGKLSIFTMLSHAPIVNAGYVMLASQYRQQDEFGGKDLKDVISLVKLGQQLSTTQADNVHMLGVSRGGMMTYIAAKELPNLRSISVWAGPTDLETLLPYRPEMERVYQARIPNYQTNKKQALAQRSVMNWTKNLPKQLPILLLHGDADKAVNVIHTTQFAEQLLESNHPHKLVIYKGDNHGLRKNRKQAYTEIVTWLNTYSTNI